MMIYLDLYRINDTSFYKTLLTLNVVLHDELNVKTKYESLLGTPQPDFALNNLRLSYAIARTLCSHHPDREEYYLDVAASYFGLLNIVEHPHNNGNFVLLSDRLKRLRDFSRTSRIGELAQGVNYLFTQERLGFPFVIDYHLFCELTGIATTGRSPDFVVLSRDMRTLGLMESKGESPSGWGVKGKLKSALEQIELTVRRFLRTLLPIRKKIPCCTKFSSDIHQASTIHYCDIDIGTPTAWVLKPGQLFKLHYASWFYLVGDFHRARQLVANGNMTNLTEATEQGIIYTFDERLQVYWIETIVVDTDTTGGRLRFLLERWPPRHRNFALGIHKSVVDILVKPSDAINEVQIAPGETGGNYEWFNDATVLRFQTRR